MANVSKRIMKRIEQVVAARMMVLQKDISAFQYLPAKFPAEGVYKAFSVVRLVVSEDKGGVKTKVTLTQRPASRLSPYVEDYIVPDTIAGVMVDRFCPSFLDVRIEGKENKGELAAGLLNGVIYRYHNDFYVENEDKSLFHLNDSTGVEREVLFESDGTLKSNVFIYGDPEKGCALSSNGQIKKLEVTLPCNNLPGFDFEYILNELTFGLIAIMKKYPRFAKKVKEFAQASTRVAQIAAPAVEGLSVGVFAVYMGIYSDMWDGEIYLQDEYVAKWYEDRLGEPYAVLRHAVRGVTMQCRPYMCKGNGSVVSRSYMNGFLKFNFEDVEIIERENMTEKDQVAFNMAVWSKGKEGKFAGKLVILCDNTEELKKLGVQVFTDLNGLKETFELTRKSGLNVLDTTEESEHIKTSTQTLATYIVADEKRAHSFFMEKAKRTIKTAYEEVMANEGRSVTAAEAENALSPMELGKTLFPKFMRECWQPGYRGIVKNTIQGLSTKFDKCNLVNDGAFCVIAVDPCIDFGFEGLKFGNGVCEVFCKDLGGKKAMMVRYPKANAFGFSVVQPVTTDELINRGREAGVSEEHLELLRERLDSTPEGITILPASQSLMDKHDGHDFDGDHVQLATEEEAVSIVDKKDSIIVHICEDQKSYTNGAKKHQ